MFRFNTLGRHTMTRVLFAFLACWISALAYGATLDNPESDYNDNEDDAPKTFDYDGIFDWVGLPTFSASSSDPSKVTVSIDTLAGEFTVTPVANANTPPPTFVTITVGVSDIGGLATDSFNVTLNPRDDDPTVIAPIPNTTVAEDSGPWTINLNTVFEDVDVATNGDTLTFTHGRTNGALYGPGTGIVGSTLTLVPAANMSGTSTVTVTADDDDGDDVSDVFTFTVTAVNDPPVATGPVPTVTVAEDSGAGSTSMAGVFTDVDGPGITLSVVGVTNPGLFSVAPNMAGTTLTFTAGPNQNGNSSVTVQASDGTLTATVSVSITITPTNDAPTVVGAAGPLVVAEDSVAQTLSLAGMFGDIDAGDSLTLTVDGVSNATLFSAVSPPSVSGTTLTLTFAANATGSSAVSIRATDIAGASVVGGVTVTVTPVNDAPTVAAPMPDLIRPEDAPPTVISLAPVFADVDIATDGDVLTFTVTNTNPGLLTASIAGGDLTLTLLPDMNGVATITVTATDTFGASVSEPFDVTVDAVDDMPIAADDTGTMVEDGPALVINVLANDYLGEAPTAIVSAGTTHVIAGVSYPDSSESTPLSMPDGAGGNVTLPSGALVINGSEISYTPRQNFSGSDFFTYTIEDADGQQSTATVNITITGQNDSPAPIGSISYTIVQATFLNILAAGGLADQAFDADGDPVSVIQDTAPASILLGYPGTTLSLAPDGSFNYTPDVNFVGTDSFVIRFFDGVLTSAAVTVTIEVTPTPPPPAPPPAGEVEFDFDLADVPLEDAISAEANVLVIMDDSGSMDWAIMAPGVQGEFWIANGATKNNTVASRTNSYRYIVPLATNVYGNTNVLPTQQALDGDPDFAGNDYGVWRGRNAQYNTIYYNPEIEYRPWVGLDRNNVEFANVNPTAAPLDPYVVPLTTINLTTPINYFSNSVPKTRNGGSSKNLNNLNVYIPSYYTTTATGTPAHNAPRTLVEIRNNGTTYAGGAARFDCAVGDDDPLTCTYDQEIQNFANWFTYYRSREYSAKAALGRAVADVTNLRMGYVVLNDSNERIRIAPMNASYRVGNKRALMHQIYKIDSNNGTPLRAALDRAGKHFECRTGDSFGSNANTNPGHVNCPVLPSPEGQCQNNFAMLFSDGTWNGTFNLRGNEDGNANSQFDGPLFRDTISRTLADVAMYYYERDLHPSLPNGVPTTARDIAGAPVGAFGASGEVMHQHMKTYTIGFGLEGLIDPSTVPANYATAFAWNDPFNDGLEKVDDMLHAAVNGRGAFLQANNPVLLSQAFQNAFAEFSDGSVSVSAVAFNSTALREQTVEYRGFFNLRFNTGDLRALTVDPATGLVDNVTPLWRAAVRLDTQLPANRVIVTYDRVNDQGVPFRHGNLNANQQSVLSLNEVNFVRGDRSQEEPAGAFRQRPAVEGLLGDIVHSAPQYVGGPRAIRRDQSPYPTQAGELYSAFKAANATREALVYVGANDGMLHGFAADTGNERIGYVPNKLIDASQRFKNELDLLTSLTYSHKFFVDVTPTVEDVYMPPTKTAIGKDWTTILVGALGGGGKGYYAMNVSDPASRFTSEANAASAVLWEFTDADDTYPLDSAGNPLGGGGLVDLAGQPIRDLGYAYSPAQLVMSNVSDGGTPAQKKWTAIFGNGYNSTAGVATLFVLNIEDGLNGWAPGDFVKLTTGEGVKSAPDPLAGLPNGLGVPAVVDRDLNGTADLVYAGDLFGNLYRFNITDPNRANWTVTKVFQATYDNAGTIERQPITTQPYVTKHPSGTGFLIVFGTGSYVTEGDGVSLEVQSVYGIWDRLDINPPTALANAKSTRLVEQTITNVYTPALGGGTTSTFERLRYSSNNPVNYLPDVGVTAGVYGWYFDLDMVRPAYTADGVTVNPDTSGNAAPLPQYPGERAIRRFVPRGTALLVTTVIPRDENTCFRSPPGSTFPIDYLTGGTPTRPILDLNNDGVINDQDMVTVGGEQYAAGILFDTDDLDGTLVDPSVLLGTGDADFLFLSGGDDQVTLRIAGPDDPKTGRLSWRELDDAN